MGAPCRRREPLRRRGLRGADPRLRSRLSDRSTWSCTCVFGLRVHAGMTGACAAYLQCRGVQRGGGTQCFLYNRVSTSCGSE